jgi:hypothetical protein
MHSNYYPDNKISLHAWCLLFLKFTIFQKPHMSKSEAKAEAMWYLTNAKEILSEKTKKENGCYSDPKYIKMA